MIPKESKILITGASGLVGTALVEELQKQNYRNLVLCSKNSCDLRDFNSVKLLFSESRPDVVFHLAATVYGIGGNLANKGVIYFDNIMINTHVLEASRLAQVKKIIAMGTVASYPDPKHAPVKEDFIWNGRPHGSEDSYGYAKRAMLAQLIAYQDQYKMDYAYVISTNLYGPHDKFDTQNGHVLPSLIRKFYEAANSSKTISVWGDGSSARDFLYSKDLAKALCLIMNQFSGTINVASGVRTTIRHIVNILTNYFEIEKQIEWDTSKPNGREFYDLELSKLHSLNFKPSYSIEDGLGETLNWFCKNYKLNLIRK